METDVIRDFTDPQVRIKQQSVGLLNPYSAKVFRKSQACPLLEHLAKIERADVHRMRDVIQIDRICLVANDVRSRPANQGRFSFILYNMFLLFLQFIDYSEMARSE
jgi:hypothetical protein